MLSIKNPFYWAVLASGAVFLWLVYYQGIDAASHRSRITGSVCLISEGCW